MPNYIYVYFCRDMFFILTCGTSKCLIRADHVEGGPTVKMNVGTAMAVNVVTGCLFTVQQSTGAIIQIPYYTGSSCPDMKYNNPFPNDYSINREHITAHSVQLQDSVCSDHSQSVKHTHTCMLYYWLTKLGTRVSTGVTCSTEGFASWTPAIDCSSEQETSLPLYSVWEFCTVLGLRFMLSYPFKDQRQLGC